MSDTQLVEEITRKTEPVTPHGLANDRYRENVIRLQCRYLSEIGLIAEICPEIYVQKPEVELSKYEIQDGYVVFENSLTIPNWRISDFSALDWSDIKLINKGFFENRGSKRYRHVDGDKQKTERKIMSVKGWKLERVMDEFPRWEALPQQCAHWMRAFSGIHFFPDANHRTGMASLFGLLEQNGYAPSEWPGKSIRRAVVQSKILRGLYSNVKFNTLWEHDELYYHWLRYFRKLLSSIEMNEPEGPDTKDLEKILEFGRRENI